MGNDVTITVPADQIANLAAADLLKALTQEERQGLIGTAIRELLKEYRTRDVVLKAMEPELSKLVLSVAESMTDEIQEAVRNTIQAFINDLPRRIVGKA